eukprot:9134031-Pyramimonas_sp.AAC.1
MYAHLSLRAAVLTAWCAIVPPLAALIVFSLFFAPCQFSHHLRAARLISLAAEVSSRINFSRIALGVGHRGGGHADAGEMSDVARARKP